jgi:alkaline phosphatase D
MILSGDTHWGELSKYEQDMPYPLWEVTSSGLTEEWKAVSPNKHRVGDYTHNVNYGFIDIDWQQTDPSIHFGLKNEQGKLVNSTSFSLSEISPFK